MPRRQNTRKKGQGRSLNAAPKPMRRCVGGGPHSSFASLSCCQRCLVQGCGAGAVWDDLQYRCPSPLWGRAEVSASVGALRKPLREGWKLNALLFSCTSLWLCCDWLCKVVRLRVLVWIYFSLSYSRVAPLSLQFNFQFSIFFFFYFWYSKSLSSVLWFCYCL